MGTGSGMRAPGRRGGNEGGTSVLTTMAPLVSTFSKEQKADRLRLSAEVLPLSQGRRSAFGLTGVPWEETAPLFGTTAEQTVRGTRGRRTQVHSSMPGTTTLQLLVVDEDAAVSTAVCDVAKEMGFEPHQARSAQDIRTLVAQRTVDVILLDLSSRGDRFGLLEELRATCPRAPIVVMTAFATVHSAVDAMRLGASDYLAKPFAMDELTATLESAAQRRQFDTETRRLRERAQAGVAGAGVIGASEKMEKLLRMVTKVATAAHPVLITGESGTGKETIARLIHESGPGGQELPYVSLDCSAIPAAKLETMLFGYVRRENTAEREEHQGELTRPSGGTLFLEEICDLSLDLQVKLLRAMQEKSVRPAGAAASQPVTVRLLAASSRDLPLLMETGAFRKDLYFRLNMVHLKVPPLRERKEDIPLLATYFVRKQSRNPDTDFRLDGEVLNLLNGYDWPGNVRELEVSIERACAMTSGPVIYLNDFPTQLQGLRQQLGLETGQVDARVGSVAKREQEAGVWRGENGLTAPGIVSIAELERHAILTAIGYLKGDKLMAAKLLGIGKTTLYRKLKEYGIEEE